MEEFKEGKKMKSKIVLLTLLFASGMNAASPSVTIGVAGGYTYGGISKIQLAGEEKKESKKDSKKEDSKKEDSKKEDKDEKQIGKNAFDLNADVMVTMSKGSFFYGLNAGYMHNFSEYGIEKKGAEAKADDSKKADDKSDKKEDDKAVTSGTSAKDLAKKWEALEEKKTDEANEFGPELMQVQAEKIKLFNHLKVVYTDAYASGEMSVNSAAFNPLVQGVAPQKHESSLVEKLSKGIFFDNTGFVVSKKSGFGISESDISDYGGRGPANVTLLSQADLNNLGLSVNLNVAAEVKGGIRGQADFQLRHKIATLCSQGATYGAFTMISEDIKKEMLDLISEEKKASSNGVEAPTVLANVALIKAAFKEISDIEKKRRKDDAPRLTAQYDREVAKAKKFVQATLETLNAGIDDNSSEFLKGFVSDLKKDVDAMNGKTSDEKEAEKKAAAAKGEAKTIKAKGSNAFYVGGVAGYKINDKLAVGLALDYICSSVSVEKVEGMEENYSAMHHGFMPGLFVTYAIANGISVKASAGYAIMFEKGEKKVDDSKKADDNKTNEKKSALVELDNMLVINAGCAFTVI